MEENNYLIFWRNSECDCGIKLDIKELNKEIKAFCPFCNKKEWEKTIFKKWFS